MTADREILIQLRSEVSYAGNFRPYDYQVELKKHILIIAIKNFPQNSSNINFNYCTHNYQILNTIFE